MIGIYKITSPTGKIYIGQSVDIFKRVKFYENETCKRQPKLYASIKKHGWSNHKFEVVEECLEKDLNIREKFYIDLHNSFNTIYGMNLRGGSDLGGGRISDETREKLCVIRRKKARWAGNKNPMFGKKPTDDHRLKMRLGMLKKYPNGNLEALSKMRDSVTGKKQSIDHVLKRSMAMRGVAKTESHKRKLSEIKSVPIVQLDLNGVFVKEWGSAKEVERILGFWQSDTRRVCIGKYKQSHGFIWKYKAEYDKGLHVN